ncbi:response regulator transcription factor [Aurantibacter crassamenti]|uniref:LytR/AlgR family response regulator transcription factor n=1 Tax=Aurantibacter crassamenti TaxID=1837375 RepID=UPI001939B715|nr:LytTR family DNA-binding domain-containing protein [Aurantibacter crassamenti]MBM1107917.1 response regulator transcription factor [Aurantibacter crassamenti]
MLKAIIVDDEQHCIDRVVKLLSDYSETINLLACCNSVDSAIKEIEAINPDVVFLDVHLQNQTGFDLLAKLSKVDFEVVFTTAYDSYAVEAFRFSALDYLLKPIDSVEFERAIEKIEKTVGLKDTSKKLEVLFHNFENNLNRAKKVAIPALDGLKFINTNEIVRCQSDASYTHIFLSTGKKFTATKTLKFLEELLGSNDFFRVHKSHYINLSYVDKYIKGKGGYLLMKDGATVEVAMRRKEEFLKKITN